MEFRQRTDCLESWKQMCGSFIVILGVLVGEVVGDKNCPVSAGTLSAYMERNSYSFYYTFEPFIKTNIDLLDNLLTSSKEVTCNWVLRTKLDHTAAVQIEDFHLTPAEGTRHADCLKIYDGMTSESDLLGEMCGGDLMEEESKTFSATGRYLLVVYMQGEVTGDRGFTMFYFAKPKSIEMILKIAGIVCGSLAALAIVFLTFKFTRNCRPCCKRCCPDQEAPLEGATQRELRPLSPATLAPPSVGNSSGGVRGRGGADVRGGASAVAVDESRSPSRGVQDGRQGGEEGGQEEEEEEFSVPVDEPPPSYDSIFANDEERNKPN